MIQSPLRRIAGKVLSTDLCERLTAHAALQHEYKSVLTTPKFGKLTDFWDSCINKVGRDKSVLFLEFGVWEGYSIKYFSQNFPNLESRFFGCDSFIGLPERWGTLKESTFSTEGRIPEISDTRVSFVKGWFQNTFDSTINLAHKSSCEHEEVLIHFDADLYSSTLFLLTSLHREFDHYYFIFDEFAGHETRALLNFQQAYGVNVEFYCHRGSDLPEQVFGRMDNLKAKYQPSKR